MTATQGYLKMVITYCMKQQPKLKPLMRFIDPNSGDNSTLESHFRINDIHDPQFLDL